MSPNPNISKMSSIFEKPGSNPPAPAPAAWPISGATFILLHKNQTNAEAGTNVLKFFDWAYKEGNAPASQLDYVPLPDNVKQVVRKSWAANVKAGNRALYPF